MLTRVYREALAMSRELFGDVHMDIAELLDGLGVLPARDPQGAERAGARAIDSLFRLVGTGLGQASTVV